jgi:hypothetical protein
VDLEIRWPSGSVQQVTGLPVNTRTTIVESVPETWIVAGTGQLPGNPARLRCFLPAGREVTTSRIVPFATGGFGVGTAVADLDGDGRDEIIASAGPSPAFAPQLRAFDPLDGPLANGSLLAFATAGYGVVAAGGDRDGDGRDELAVAPGPGTAYGAVVAFYRYGGEGAAWERLGVPPFLAYGDAVRGGARLAWGDLDGDGRDELVTAPGPLPANGAHIRGWRVSGEAAEPLPWADFLAFSPSVGYGAVTVCGDLDGDGRDELVTAPGPGPAYGPHVRVWRLGPSAAPVLLAEGVLDGDARYGARLACGDLDGDGVDELVAASGPDPASTSLVRVWRLDDGRLVRLDGAAFHAFDAYAGGAEPAVGRFPEPVRHLVK